MVLAKKITLSDEQLIELIKILRSKLSPSNTIASIGINDYTLLCIAEELLDKRDDEDNARWDRMERDE